MENNSNAIAEIQKKYAGCNLLMPAATEVQLNPFYKITVMEVTADLSENSGDIFKVGSVKTGTTQQGKDIWEETYSPAKPLLMKIAAAAGIQFDPDHTYGTKIDANTYKAKAYGAMRITDVLERRAVRGYKDSVVEKYSDQVHFIYELLQNVADACATRARFILEEKRLIFAHNGTRHFSISNPANEYYDSEKKTLGDINAITSIANSNKTQASIEKFGVGVKAVFQYTETPFIYDSDFKFKIERFIVPRLLTEDFLERRVDETFEAEVDKRYRQVDRAGTDIQ